MIFKKRKPLISITTVNERIEMLKKIENDISLLEPYEISRYDKQNNKFTCVGCEYGELYNCLLKHQPLITDTNKQILKFYNVMFFEIMCLPSGHDKLVDFEQLYKCIASIYSKIIDDYTEN